MLAALASLATQAGPPLPSKSTVSRKQPRACKTAEERALLDALVGVLAGLLLLLPLLLQRLLQLLDLVLDLAPVAKVGGRQRSDDFARLGAEQQLAGKPLGGRLRAVLCQAQRL